MEPFDYFEELNGSRYFFWKNFANLKQTCSEFGWPRENLPLRCMRDSILERELITKRAMAKRPKPIVLTVLDGWGYRAETKGNAIALARKPTYDELLRKFPNTLIQTSGPYGRLARRADGQQRSGPHEYRCGAHRAHGHYAHRSADRQQATGPGGAVPARPWNAAVSGNCIFWAC